MPNTMRAAATGLPDENQPPSAMTRDIELVHVYMLLSRASLIVRKMLVHADAKAARAMLAKEAGQ
jgi:hypothetical protein